jgi:hypothetical protein
MTMNIKSEILGARKGEGLRTSIRIAGRTLPRISQIRPHFLSHRITSSVSLSSFRIDSSHISFVCIHHHLIIVRPASYIIQSVLCAKGLKPWSVMKSLWNFVVVGIVCRSWNSFHTCSGLLTLRNLPFEWPVNSSSSGSAGDTVI